MLACKVKARDGEVEGKAEAKGDTRAENGWYRACDRPRDAKDADEEAGDESMSGSMTSGLNGPC